MNLQEHVFSSGHIAQVKALLENGGNMPNSNDDQQNSDKSPSVTPTPHQKPQSVAASIIGGLYNQFLMQQNHQQHEVTAAINMMNTSGGSATSSSSGDLMANLNNLQQQQMENNLLLQINADQQPSTPPTTNSEILQQLYNYSQMSGELIK